MLRIDKQQGKYRLLEKADEGKPWLSKGETLKAISRQEARQVAEAEIDGKACALLGDGRLFLKLTPGARYRVTSPTGKGFQVKQSETGYLIWAASGFEQSAIELHRLSAQAR